MSFRSSALVRMPGSHLSKRDTHPSLGTAALFDAADNPQRRHLRVASNESRS
jgi:hypothetical protein